MAYQLAIVKGRSANQAVPISAETPLTIGRQDGCQLRIASSQVSRKHCEIKIQNGKLFVRDLQSSNGTFLDGLRIDAETEIQPGQLLTIGNVVFRVEDASAGQRDAGSVKPQDSALAQQAPSAEGDYEIEADDTPLPPQARKQAGRLPAGPAPDLDTDEKTIKTNADDDQPIELSEDDVIDFLSDLEPDPEPKKK